MRMDLPIDLQSHVLARISLGHVFMVDLKRRDRLAEIGRMSLKMNRIPDPNRPRQLQDGDSDPVEVMSHLADRFFWHHSLLPIRPPPRPMRNALQGRFSAKTIAYSCRRIQAVPFPGEGQSAHSRPPRAADKRLGPQPPGMKEKEKSE
mgnify:CR=1 FL=1